MGGASNGCQQMFQADFALQMNVSSKVVRLASSVEQDELHVAIDAACADPEVDGVLVQLPLPPHLNEYDAMERVDPKKDVDGFHPLNMGRMLARNAPPRFVPATALGCMQLLQRYSISVTVRCADWCLPLFKGSALNIVF
jgi:methylenetetrahydrofolate dehydrogenase (NADP+) / methenyltetrahydrofolate cyclohydrolase